MKTLFFDIETSPCIGYFWRPGHKVRLSYDNVIEDAKIICISWKWADSEPQTFHWGKKKCDKSVVKRFAKVMAEADLIVAHNGDRFDLPWFRARCLKHGIKNLPRYRTLDTLKSTRANIKLPSNRLNDIAQYYGIGEKIETTYGLWKDVMQGNKEALDHMVKYCEQDVILLQQVYEFIQGVVPQKTHAGVINGGEKWSCPSCGSVDVVRNGTDVTPQGTKKQKMKCNSCGRGYRVTGLQYTKYLEYKIKG